MSQAAIHVYLISGFLGSGKTTLLNRMLKETPPDVKLMVLMNEFGEEGIDGRQDFARLRLVHATSLPELKRRWLAALDQAAEFVAARPPDELGCLYYSQRLGRFPRTPGEAGDVVPHYGCPGGALPGVG